MMIHGALAPSPGLTTSVIYFQTGFQINVVHPETTTLLFIVHATIGGSIRKSKSLRKFITATEQNLLQLLSLFKNTSLNVFTGMSTSSRTASLKQRSQKMNSACPTDTSVETR